MNIKECCYNCCHSERCDYEYGVFCFKFAEIRSENDCCEGFELDDFCADPYE